jgi:hypothetical protein
MFNFIWHLPADPLGNGSRDQRMAAKTAMA